MKTTTILGVSVEITKDNVTEVLEEHVFDTHVLSEILQKFGDKITHEDVIKQLVRNKSLKEYLQKAKMLQKKHPEYTKEEAIKKAIQIWNPIFGQLYRKHLNPEKEFPPQFIDEYVNELDWDYISAYWDLSETFIEKYKNKVNWGIIWQRQKLSEAFIEKHIDKVNWHWIWKHQKLSEAFIEKHINKVNWDIIWQHQKLPETFIEKHINKVIWPFIWKYQKVSETFIEKHIDKVNWQDIAQFQELSVPFIEKHLSKLTLTEVCKYQKLTDEFILKHIDELQPIHIESLINNAKMQKSLSATITTTLILKFPEYKRGLISLTKTL